MRKILLASTALVAMTSVSAMAADVTISGSFEFGYQNTSQNDAYADTAGRAPNAPTNTVAALGTGKTAMTSAWAAFVPRPPAGPRGLGVVRSGLIARRVFATSGGRMRRASCSTRGEKTS